MKHSIIMASFFLFLLGETTMIPARELAEDSQVIHITRKGSQPPTKGSSEYFVGAVQIDSPFQGADPARVSGATVTFEPGARTHWHSHPLGQTLIVTSGIGRVQRQGGPVEEIRTGDTVWIPPHVKHWHGAAPNSPMSHIAINEGLNGKVVDWMEKVTDEQYCVKPTTTEQKIAPSAIPRQQPDVQGGGLSAPEISLVKISASTARGHLADLDAEIRAGLEAGLTVNQIKTALEQLYAYCGFPRSLNGIMTLKSVVESRRQQGIEDKTGETHEPVASGDRYERGRATLEKLTGTPQSKPAPGFGEFSPEIDRFLKEHLFADIFDNQILSHRERELVTIAALAAMSGVESQLNAHINIGKNTGITNEQLAQLANLIEGTVNRSQANQVRKLLGRDELPVVGKDILVRLSEIQIAPDSREQYLALLQEEARQSVEREPGVICIFPLVRQDDSFQVRIVEIYKDRTAYESHIESPHFQHYKTSTLPMVKSLNLVDMQILDPETMQKLYDKLK